MGNRIKELRLAKGLSQDALAEATGTSGQQIARLEKDERKLTQQWMRRIGEALNVSPIELLPASDREAKNADQDGQLVQNEEQLALRRFWSSLSDTAQILILAKVRDDLRWAVEITKRNNVTGAHSRLRDRRRK